MKLVREITRRSLEENGTFESQSSFIVNSRLGYRSQDWKASLDVLNLFDRDIEYFYQSRLNLT